MRLCVLNETHRIIMQMLLDELKPALIAQVTLTLHLRDVYMMSAFTSARRVLDVI